MTTPLWALVVEDNYNDVLLITEELKRGGFDPHITNVDTAEDMRKALDDNSWDIVLSDYFMPRFSAPAALQVLKEKSLDLPFVVVTGSVSEEVAAYVMKLGAADYVLKENLTRLPEAVRRELKEAKGRIARHKAEEQVKETLKKLSILTRSIIKAFVAAIESRDPYTAGHQLRVAKLARAMSREMGLSEGRVEGLYMAASIHDLGKINVPSEILSKPGALEEAEMSIIRTHPSAGYQILEKIEFPWPVAEIVVQHHERLDGSGYPKGLTADEIMPEAKIMAVADVVEAMSSHRPYRPKHELQAALDEVVRYQGELYDADVVEVCLNVVKRGFKFK